MDQPTLSPADADVEQPPRPGRWSFLAGSPIVESLQLRDFRWMCIGSFASFTLALLSQTTSYALALPMLMFMGLVSSVFMSLNMTLLQLHAAPEMRGRVMSIAMMTWGLMPLGALPFGAIAESIGTTDSLMLSGLMLAGFTVVFAVGYPRFRRIAGAADSVSSEAGQGVDEETQSLPPVGEG